MNDLYIHLLNMSLLPLRLGRFLFNRNKLKIKKINESLLQNSYGSSYSPKKIISWNIQELFFYTNVSKVNNIVGRLKSFDADTVCLQEVFEDRAKEVIINELRDKYPYFLLGHTKKKYIIGEDSGLLILSRYPIEFVKENLLKDPRLPDSLANKTVLYFKIGNLNFATTHLQSSYSDISEKQLLSLVNNSPFDNFIIIGDLNNTNADKILDINKNNICNTYEDCILDYIINIGYKDINIEVESIEINIKNTTDHLPIIGKIKSQ